MWDWLVFRIPGWNRKIRRLRRDWNRARENTLKKKNPLKLMILRKLDSVEDHLKMLEEQRMSRHDRKRFAREVEIVLAEVKVLLKGKAEEFTTTAAQPRRLKK